MTSAATTTTIRPAPSYPGVSHAVSPWLITTYYRSHNRIVSVFAASVTLVTSPLLLLSSGIAHHRFAPHLHSTSCGPSLPLPPPSIPAIHHLPTWSSCIPGLSTTLSSESPHKGSELATVMFPIAHAWALCILPSTSSHVHAIQEDHH